MNNQSNHLYSRKQQRATALLALLVMSASLNLQAADDLGANNIPFAQGDDENQYRHIGFITDLVFASDTLQLEREGYYLLRRQDNSEAFVSSKLWYPKPFINTSNKRLFLGYRTTQESSTDIASKLLYNSTQLRAANYWTPVPTLDGTENKFRIDPGSYHLTYDATLGVHRYEPKDDRRGMAAPLVYDETRNGSYPVHCNVAYDNTDATLYKESGLYCWARDVWNLDFCNVTTDPDKLNTNLELKSNQGFVSFYKHVPDFTVSDFYTKLSSIAIVMHYTDPQTGEVRNQEIFRHENFDEQQYAKSGVWDDDPQSTANTPVGQVKVVHGMKTQAKHRTSYLADWEEWRVYLVDNPELADRVSLTFYEIHDRVLQYRTFSLYSTRGDVTDIDPYINIEATSDGIGSIVKSFVCSTKVKAKALYNVTDGKFIYTKSTSDEGTMVTYVLPATDHQLDYVAYIYAESSYSDTTEILIKVPFTTPIFHTLSDMKVTIDYQPDSLGIMHPINKIRWNTANAKTEDILETDLFLVMRANNPNFTDETCVDQIDFNRSGAYECTDEIEPTFYSIDSTGQARQKIYYRVTRAFVYANWNGNEGGYDRSGELSYPLQLPHVTGITYAKQDTLHFDDTHKVRIRVDLANPWHTMTASEVADSVAARREYVWDSSARIVIRRTGTNVNGHAVDDVDKRITIEGNQVHWDAAKQCYYAEVDDVQTFGYTYYYYQAEVDLNRSDYLASKGTPVITSLADARDCYIETMALVTDLTATYGEEARVDGICLEWVVEENAIQEFCLERSLHGRGAWMAIAPLLGGNEQHYLDTDVRIGEVYDYRLTAKVTFRDRIYTKSYDVTGCRGYYGRISGTVSLTNGQRMPGQVEVTLTSLSAVSYGEAAGYRQAASVKEGAQVKVTTTDGSFAFDNVLLPQDGSKYRVDVSYPADGNVNFINATGRAGSFEVTLNQDVTSYAACDFTCKTSYRYSGRVLYEGSTIPVRDVHFLYNGLLMVSEDGTPVTTDQKGNFSFIVPRANATVQATIEGHTMKGEGLIMNATGDTCFTPTQDLDGLRLWDQTRVRLVGRLVGGNKQGRLPMGFGLSHNNLGDDLKMVLEVEGDASALVVYDDNDPDVISRDSIIFSQTVTSKQTGAREIDSTLVNFQHRRIEIFPNVETGEFCVDLYPVKYKISELSAKGYATLYNQGEGLEVLDLTQAARELQTAHDTATFVYETQYHATYSRIYHSPATVNFTQARYGLDQRYYGSEKMKVYTLNGATQKVNLVAYDKQTDRVIYTFGHPLFCETESYTLKAHAYEKYYYNGMVNGTRADSCSLDGSATLIVRNGLVDSDNVLTLKLDEEGRTSFTFRPRNTSFTLTGDKSLLTLSAQVKINNYYYDAQGIQAYVTGSKLLGNDAVDIADGPIRVFDVVRDPYGAKSTAYRESGTKYSYKYKFNVGASLTPTITIYRESGASSSHGSVLGVASPATFSGIYKGETISAKTSSSYDISYNVFSGDAVQNVEYSMTLNEKVSTSSDVKIYGANGDVYIGMIESYAIQRGQAIICLDDTTYSRIKASIDAKSTRIIASGQDTTGQKYYLAIQETFDVGASTPREFMYNGRHINGVLIPDLWQQYKSMILTGTHDEIQQLANQKGEVKWRLIEGKDITQQDCYEAIYPETSDKPKVAYSPANLLSTIYNWIQVVANNEQEKLNAMSAGSPYHSYDISAGTTLNHTESASWIDTTRIRVNVIGINVMGQTFDPKLSAALTTWKNKRSTGVSEESATAQDPDAYHDEDNGNWGFYINTPGYEWKWTMKPGFNITWDRSHDYSLVHTGASGYTLQESEDGYLQEDVYAVEAKGWNSLDQNAADGQLSYDAWDNLESAYSEGHHLNSSLKGYVFTVRAGAQRNPWFAPDSTLYYKPGTPLTKATLKIDNPRIYCDQPVVSNIPADQKATFRVRLANETELPAEGLTGLTASKLVLKLAPNSNPNGAKVTYNGQPLIGTVSVKVMPNETYDAVIEVERVGDAYDFENLVVQLADQSATLTDGVKLSAHFVPTSSPVTLQQPTAGWVMNTLSSHDENGYYIPVKISGFDVNHANFDHIELQYKRHTEGDDRWTTLRSFYCDQKLYEAATGNKEKFDGTTIEGIPFYGDTDPFEMQYDLRAVTFCRLGSGFVTRSSDVITGTKDTRAPRVFGMPKPTNGILTFEDVISIPFNEPIAYNYLDETANFQVYGYTNDADEEYNTTLLYDNNWDDTPETQVTRSFTQSDFTLDMMVKSKVTGEYEPCNFFALNSYDNADIIGEYRMVFGYASKEYMPDMGDVLFLAIDRKYIASEPLSKYNLSVTKDLTHVGVSVHNGKPTFFVEDHELPAKVYQLEYAGPTLLSYDPLTSLTGKLEFGPFYQGEITDVRIWNKALTVSEFTKYKAKHLSPTTPGLSGHWPMNEAQGTTLYDEVNGADLTLGGQVWKQSKGQYSLHLNGKSLQLDKEQCYQFMRGDDDDYTLGLWYRIDTLYSAAELFTPLFQAGSSKNDSNGIQVGIKGNSLLLLSNGKEYAISSAQERNDRQWHHFSISANKSHNFVSLYRDGELTETLSGQEVSGISTNYVELGSAGLGAHFDCLTFWHMALPTNTITRTYLNEPTGREAEMAYYLPFEVSTRNEQGTLTTKFSLTNEIYEVGRDGKRLATQSLFTAAEAEMEAMGDAHVFCPLRSMTGLTNLKFNWTASDNELQVNIDKSDASINHQNLFVTVRNVEDMAGNLLENPTMLTVYVDRNVLKWDVREYHDVICYGSGAEFQLKWSNVSGKRLNYTIQNYNAWLANDVEMGVADPMGYGTVNFHVVDGLAPGEYSATVYLIDEDKLTCPVNISIEVKAEEPDWKLVDTEEYNLQMNLIGKLYLSTDMTKIDDKTIDLDRRDIVAAFYEGMCVGRTYISADNAKYNVFMTIYGNADMQPNKGFAGADLEFRLWRASTGKIEILRDVVGEEGIVRFVPYSTVGTPAQPVIFTVTEKSIQALDLKKGWNWVSLYLDPTDKSSPNTLFLDNAPFSQNDRIKFNASCYSVFADNDTISEWSSTLVKGVNKMCIDRGRVYQIYMNKAGIAYVSGTAIPAGERAIQVKPKDWTELAYMLKTDLPIRQALSDFQIGDKAADGTIIKSYDQFAVASINGTSREWVGSLQYLHPGQGYYIYSTHAEEQRLEFVESQSAVSTAASTRASGDAEVAEHFASMPVVAAFAPQLEALPTDEVYAYVGNEVVGHAQLMDCGRIGQRYFLSVNAEQGDVVTFAQVRAGEVIGFCDAQITFDGNQVVGTLDQPLLLQAAAGMVHVTPNLFTQYVDFTICTPASIQAGEPIQLSLYNTAGALIWQRELQASASGITRQRMDGSWLAPGVYVAHIITGGCVESVRLIRK